MRPSSLSRELIFISPHLIDCSGKWLFWRSTPSSGTFSLAERGLLPPVLVSESREDRGYVLVWGIHIVESYREKGRNVPSLVGEFSSFEKALINIAMDAPYGAGAPLFLRCVRFFYRLDENGVEEMSSHALGGLLSSREIGGLVKWVRNLSPSWDILCEKGHLVLDCVDLLGRFSQEDREWIFPFFASLRWGKNKSLEFLRLLFEISRRHLSPVREVCEGLRGILEMDLSPNDRIHRILSRLREMRYPHLYPFRRELGRWMEEMRPVKHWRWKTSSGFETNSFSLEVKLGPSYTLEQFNRDLSSIQDRWKSFYKWYCSVLKGTDKANED